MKLHLDSEYRRRFEKFYLANGKIADSRKINWRNVEWEKVVRIEVYIEGHKYIFDSNNPKFEFFMNFRWGGIKRSYINNESKIIPIHIWTVGWSDGENCQLYDLDFYTGNRIKVYNESLKKFKNHIHPRIYALKSHILKV